MRIGLLLGFIVLLMVCGCASNSLRSNPLRNLTEKQADWFERTSEGWTFE